MEQIGFVKKISNGRAEIEVKRISGCGGGCKTCSGCDTPSHMVILPNKLDAKVGDTVELKGETKHILKYMLIIYMIPFAFLLAGIIGGMALLKRNNIANYEPLSFLIGIVFMAVGYFMVKIIDKKIEKQENNIVQMTRII